MADEEIKLTATNNNTNGKGESFPKTPRPQIFRERIMMPMTGFAKVGRAFADFEEADAGDDSDDEDTGSISTASGTRMD